MEYNEEKAVEIIEKYGLNKNTLRGWKFKNSIPDRYSNEDYAPDEKVDEAGKVILSRLKDLRSSEVLNFTVLAKIAGIDLSKLNDAIKSQCRINRCDLDQFVKEVTRQRVFILNSLPEHYSGLKAKALLRNKAIKHYVVLKDTAWSKSIIYTIEHDSVISNLDYIKIRDLYLNATILMNIGSVR